MQALGVDFLAISGHKMCGPSGASALWGRAELLQAMDPFLTGGHMISSVRLEKTTWGELPHKFEAGTAPMAEAVGLGAAIDYLEAVGLDAIEAHEHELAAYALGRLAEVPGIKLYGPPADRRAGIVSFNLEDIHPHDVAQILDLQGVAIRAGPPLLPAADAEARRGRDEPGELLPLHRPRGDRPARRRPARRP